MSLNFSLVLLKKILFFCTFQEPPSAHHWGNLQPWRTATPSKGLITLAMAFFVFFSFQEL